MIFFKELELYLDVDEVITGVHSDHDNIYEDRVWSFLICSVQYIT